MVDRVNDASRVLLALKAALQADVATAQLTTKCMGLANTNAAAAANGWVGLYVNRASYRPRSIGSGQRNWTFTPSFKVIVQATDTSSGEAAYVKLERYMRSVLDVILANPTLAAYVDGTLTGIDVDYGAQEDDAKSLHFEGVVMTLTYDSRSA